MYRAVTSHLLPPKLWESASKIDIKVTSTVSIFEQNFKKSILMSGKGKQKKNWI